MDEDLQIEPGFAGETTNDDHGSPVWVQAEHHLMYDRYMGTFFVGAKHFVVEGGTFNINQPAPNHLPILNYEIRPNVGSIAYHRKRRNCVRRMYSARVHGSQSAMTAAVIEGAHAAEKLQEEILRYLNLRHPYLPQLYGMASTGRVHVAVFHDDLVPYKDVGQQYGDSHFSEVFFWTCIVHMAAKLTALNIRSLKTPT
ncbi:hypothetical protein B0H14DRAFT_2651625 [Mycena olivaceomarginata]|nr:hypothetical protein B0H14DRAFT_2651625 [Mycena olivaceomarginata]